MPKSNLGRLPFDRTDRSVRTVPKWNASVLRTERTGSGQTGPAYRVGPLSSPGPARNAEIAREFYALKMAAGSSQTYGEYITDLNLNFVHCFDGEKDCLS